MERKVTYMQSIDVWYMIVTEKELDEDGDVAFKSYIDGIWDNYDTALSYIKAVRDNFRNDSDYDKVRDERFFVGSGFIDYDIAVGTYAYEFKVRKKIVTISSKD